MRAIRVLLAVAPIGATLLMLAALSLAGMPPFSILVSELMVLRGLTIPATFDALLRRATETVVG